MPTPRKPSNVLELTGTIRGNPGRYAGRLDEPQPAEPLGESPVHLGGLEREIWGEIAAAAFWLRRPDRHAVELACRMLARIRTGEVRAAYMAAAGHILGRLGLTPADRTRVRMERPQVPAQSPLALLAAKRRGAPEGAAELGRAPTGGGTEAARGARPGPTRRDVDEEDSDYADRDDRAAHP